MKKTEIVHLKPSQLKNDFGNPRTITKQSLEELKQSLEKLGDHDIIKIDEANNIISGNQRIKAMLEMGLDMPIVCKKLIGYSDKELKAINVQSNTHQGEWDYEMLDSWKEDINDWKFDEINPNEKEFGLQTKLDEINKKECPHCGKEI